MKFWFSKKTPKDVYDVKAPYDATVEQALRVALEVNSAPAEADRDVFDFAKALRAKPEQDPAPEPLAPQPPPASIVTRPMVSRAAREEMEHRAASFRAFQMKLNAEREARIRQTMDTVREQLKQAAARDSARH